MSMLVKIKSIFSPKVQEPQQVQLAEQTKQIALAVSTGISQGVIAVLESPQFREVMEGNTRLNGIQNVVSGLVHAEGRKGLDARYIQQNAVELFHALETAMDFYKERVEARKKEDFDPEIRHAGIPEDDQRVQKQESDK